MTDKQTYLQILDKRMARQSNLSIVVKLVSMFVAFYFASMQAGWRGPLIACFLMVLAYMIDTSINIRTNQYREKFREIATAEKEEEIDMNTLPKARIGRSMAKFSSLLFYLFFLIIFISGTIMTAQY